MRRFNITAKIWLSIGVFVGGFVIATVLGQVQGFSTERQLQSAATDLFPAAQRSQMAAAAFEQVVKGFGDAVIMLDASGLDTASQQGGQVVADLRAVAAIEGLPQGKRAEARNLAAQVERYLSDAAQLYRGILDGAGMSTAMQEKMRGIAAQTESIQAALAATREGTSQELRDKLNALQAGSARQRSIALAVFAITLAIAGFIVHLTIRRSITAPIRRVIEGVQQAAHGAATASTQVAESGQVTATEAQEQAACIQETSASLEEIGATTKQNAGRAHEADGLMQSAQRTVERASSAMTQLKESMDTISASSRQASQVLKSIDEIAFHTNILALNAAVEAARAGEAGAGFSVVADEVRNLAQRAAEAAHHSTGIIEKTIVDVNQGVDLVSAAYTEFGLVTASISSGSRVVSEIARASEEQALGVQQVTTAIARISAVTQNSVANAQQTANAAADMLKRVDDTRQHLRELVGVVGLRRKG